LNNPANGGLRCIICEDILDPKHITNKEYVSDDAFPSEKKVIKLIFNIKQSFKSIVDNKRLINFYNNIISKIIQKFNDLMNS
jgi:hypothetical protein